MLKMAVKMDVMATRIKANQTNQELMQKIQGINPILFEQTQNINLEQVAITMDQFQKQMDELEIGGKMVSNQLQNQM